MRRFLACTLLALLAHSSETLGAPGSRDSDALASSADARAAAWQRHQVLAAESPFHGLAWRSIGPTIQGGRVVDIETVPGSPYAFYVAYASGGVWKTTDNGVNFAPLSDQLPTLISGDLAVDPNHPQRLWLGSGEPNSSRSSYGGLGVFRSDDGGQSFRAMGLADADRIARILVDPRDSERIFVAALGKLYSSGGERGVFRSVDGGKSWQQVLRGATPWAGAVDLVMDPRDSKVLYAALWERSRHAWNFVEGGKGSGVYKSIDGGDSWQRLEAGLPQGEHVGRIGLALAAGRPDTLYLCVDNWQPLPDDQQDFGDRPLSARRLKNMSKAEFLRQDPEEVESFIRGADLDTTIDAKRLLAMVESGELTLAQLVAKLNDANTNLFDTDIRGIEVYRSDDGGKYWQRTHQQPLRELVYTYGYYFGQIRVAPNDAERLYLLGTLLLTSADGGKTWSDRSGPQRWGNAQDTLVHWDHHALLADAGTPQRLLLGNDGGVDLSYDGGKTWLKLDAQPVGQFYTVAYDMAEPYNVYGGLQDNGTYKGSSRARWELGQDWTKVGDGDGMHVAVDLRDNKTLYTGYQFGNYQRSGRGGGHEVRPRAAVRDPALRFNWNTPLVLSAHNPDIVYVGANKLFRSMDRGETWAPISADLTTAKERGDVPYATITTLAESALAFGLLWVGTDDGNVWVSESAGANWRAVRADLPRRWVSRVEPSRHVRERAYLSLNGYRNDDSRAYLYVSDDLGRHWRSLAAGLPAESINVVREDPINAEVLYVGSDRGVYVTLDRGLTWSALATDLPKVPVHDLAIHPRERELIAATHGRSMWIVDALPIQELTSAVRKSALQVFALADIQAERNWRERPALWTDETPYQPELKIPFWAAADGIVEMTVRDAKQRPMQRLTMNARRGVNTWVWNLTLDRELALAAEQAALAAQTDVDEKGSLARTPIAESLRLGHRLLALPGEYSVQLAMNGVTSETPLQVKAPEARKPRVKAPLAIRGRKSEEEKKSD